MVEESIYDVSSIINFIISRVYMLINYYNFFRNSLRNLLQEQKNALLEIHMIHEMNKVLKLIKNNLKRFWDTSNMENPKGPIF